MEEKIIVFSDILNNREPRELQSAVGGKELALNPAQISGLGNSYQAKIADFQKNNQPVAEVAPTVNEITIEPPVANDIIEPVMDSVIPEQPVVANIDTPFVPVVDMGLPVVETPLQDSVISQNIIVDEAPVISDIPTVEPIVSNDIIAPPVADIVDVPTPEVGQVEIVPTEEKKSDYDALIEKIVSINEKYDQEIVNINSNRNQEILALLDENKQKLTDAEAQITDLKNRAEEHLKNAQAAEQIATIAHQNAQNVQTPIDFPSANMDEMSIAA